MNETPSTKVYLHTERDERTFIRAGPFYPQITFRLPHIARPLVKEASVDKDDVCSDAPGVFYPLLFHTFVGLTITGCDGLAETVCVEAGQRKDGAPS